MSRAKEWEEELIHRFPTIDNDGVPATAEFIAILEEMGGFEEGAYLEYHFLTHDIAITYSKWDWIISPIYFNKQVSGFDCAFYSPLACATIHIQSAPNAIRDFLSTHWSDLFPKEST